MFHFISGYTAKVAGTEMGVKEPKPIFSSCFGEPFLPLHPTYYADLLAQKLKKHNTNVWLINTGWTGGKVGIGKRMSLKVTRKIIDNIHDGTLDKSEFDNFPVFNMKIPRTLPGVPSDILNPKNTWSDKNAFDSTVAGLA